MKTPDMSMGTPEQSFKPGDRVRLTEAGIIEMKKTEAGQAEGTFEIEGEILGNYCSEDSLYVKFGDRAKKVKKNDVVKIE